MCASQLHCALWQAQQELVHPNFSVVCVHSQLQLPSGAQLVSCAPKLWDGSFPAGWCRHCVLGTSVLLGTHTAYGLRPAPGTQRLDGGLPLCSSEACRAGRVGRLSLFSSLPLGARSLLSPLGRRRMPRLRESKKQSVIANVYVLSVLCMCDIATV